MAPQYDDFTARIAELESELARDPSPRVFAPLAEAYRLSGRLNNALETARLGIEAHPDHVGIRVVLARAILDSEGREKALSAYGDVLTLDAGNLEAQAYRDSAPEAVEAPVASAATERPIRENETAVAPPEDEAVTAPPEDDAVTVPPGDDAVTAPPDEAPPSAPEETARSGRRSGAGSLSEELAHLADLFLPVNTNSDGPSLGPTSIATLTLAEIYSRQGLYGKAAEICERILERDPDNEGAKTALDEYRKYPASV
jgi:tetratricopeptide (TPR) repeat protein